jgi:hypothetical protein
MRDEGVFLVHIERHCAWPWLQWLTSATPGGLLGRNLRTIFRKISDCDLVWPGEKITFDAHRLAD